MKHLIAELCVVLLLAASLAGFQAPAADCVQFASDGRLSAGSEFRLTLPREIELVLAPDRYLRGTWDIAIQPIGDRLINLFDVTPPLRYRPHSQIGRGYLSARESVGFSRDEPFVVTVEGYEAAREVISGGKPASEQELLKSLTQGHLLLTITDFGLTAGIATTEESLEWISFRGKVCVPSGV
jgi:hypothetical protein